ncbi:hypothetical protein MXEN_09839 [Mycobacterium xenopi RIVM700367]|nr:hypothetical protein MXEN_09839 [Mycobacterium xenopi RIVM700367]
MAAQRLSTAGPVDWREFGFVAVTALMITAYRLCCHCGDRNPARRIRRSALVLVRALPRRLVNSVGASHHQNWSTSIW